MRIGRIELSSLRRPFLVAEAAAGHGGIPETALRAAKLAVESGADALTFQEIDEKWLYADIPELPVLPQERVGWDCLRECGNIAREAGLCFSVCVTDSASLQEALKIGIDFIKIVSYDVTFFPFLVECGRTGLPILMSTGASRLDEVERAVEAVDAAGRLVLYHTDCGYPTPDAEVNLRRMLRLKERFGFPVGYCDHTDHGLSCLAAATLGAAVIEKHFMVDRSLGGTDHMVAMEVQEITRLFTEIKRVSTMLGEGKDEIVRGDEYRREHLRRSIALWRAVPEGEMIREDVLTMLRPSGGLAWSERQKVVGKRAARDLPARRRITLEDVT